MNEKLLAALKPLGLLTAIGAGLYIGTYVDFSDLASIQLTGWIAILIVITVFSLFGRGVLSTIRRQDKRSHDQLVNENNDR
jgi:hypothetical protein